ncbi:MAG: peptidylprolyl isomerase [Lachnospiraceae bacterium]|nr:peptidylprolyl isomerase [Lachnospiraceae bacterium]
MDMADQEKKMTKYDLKQKRRQEEKKDNGGIKLLGFACAAFLAFCIGVFGFQTYQNQQLKNETYVKIGEHEVKKAEYDYYFNSGINALYSYYGTNLSYMGLDLTKDLSTQYYTETMTWQDYFDEQAVLQLQQTYALADEAEAKGFEHDATEAVDAFVKGIEDAAANVGYTTADYLKASYGNFATMKEVKTFVERDSKVSAYYDSIYDSIEVTDEEITTYYEENKDNYDSVDYLVCTIEADIPEAELEGETAETSAESEIEASEVEESETVAETLSEEEQAELDAKQQELTDAAMADAERRANEMLGKIKDEASFEALAIDYATDADAEIRKDNVKKASVTPMSAETWLFDSARQAGDKTVIEYEAGNAYYVIYFLNRYLDESKTVDVRHILVPFEEVETTEEMTEDEIASAEEEAKEKALAKAEEIYEGWLDGDATEDGFAALAEEQSTDTGSNTNGGLYEAVAKGEMVEAFNDWIFDDTRKPGDSDIVETEYGYHIMYYAADNEMAWKLDVDTMIRSNKMNEDVNALMENYEVVDENNNIAYLHVEETVAETVTETTVETGAESVEETK